MVPAPQCHMPLLPSLPPELQPRANCIPMAPSLTPPCEASLPQTCSPPPHPLPAPFTPSPSGTPMAPLTHALAHTVIHQGLCVGLEMSYTSLLSPHPTPPLSHLRTAARNTFLASPTADSLCPRHSPRPVTDAPPDGKVPIAGAVLHLTTRGGSAKPRISFPFLRISNKAPEYAAL